MAVLSRFHRQKSKLFSIPTHSKLAILSRFDFPLLLVTLLLVAIGLIIVYDASIVHAYIDFGDKYHYIKQQLIWVALGLAAMSFFAYFPYRYWRRLSLPFFVVAVLLLLAVFIPGFTVSGGGAHRWLRFGPAALQPTEIIKISTIIFLAALFEHGYRTRPFVLIISFVTLVIGIFQKDLGSAIVFALSSLIMYIIAGAPLAILGSMVPIGLVGFIVFVVTSSYRQKRILAFIDPFSDPQGYTYHISQVLIALGSGGWFGVGLGQSRQKFEFIPEVTTDSIFAIVGEEFGFVGALILICLLSFLIYRGFKIAEKAPDKFARLLTFGLTFWLGAQAAINLAAMVSLIPLTGVPLPFISYGGSALVANLVAVGIILNISRASSA